MFISFKRGKFCNLDIQQNGWCNCPVKLMHGKLFSAKSSIFL